MPQNRPGEGRVVMPSQSSQSKKPYVHQKFPSFRFHPDGRAVVVRNEPEEQDQCPPADGWATTPFPPKPRAAPPRDLTLEEMKVEHLKLQAAYSKLSQEHAEMHLAHEDLKKYMVGQSEEIAFSKKHSQVETPVVEPDTKKKK
jgi:hypothetical protein